MKKLVILILLVAALGGALASSGSINKPVDLPAPVSPGLGTLGFNSWTGQHNLSTRIISKKTPADQEAFTWDGIIRGFGFVALALKTGCLNTVTAAIASCGNALLANNRNAQKFLVHLEFGGTKFTMFHRKGQFGTTPLL